MIISNRNTYPISGRCPPATRLNMPTLLFYFVLFNLYAPFTAAENLSNGIGNLVQQKQILTRKLDSLDLLKQQMKRQGVPINNVEHNQKTLRDSIALLKTSIQSHSEHTPAAQRPSETILFFPKPSNLFDWIIVIVGFIATFSGIMLLAGVLRSIKARRKKIRRQRLQQQYQNNVASTPPPPVYPQPPEPAYPEPEQPNTTEAYTSTGKQHPPLPDTGTIALLRERVKRYSPSEPEQTPTPPRPVMEKPLLPPESINMSSNRGENSLENAILEAAEDGLDHTAISKKFHVSIDHISLLLKIADKKR